MKKISLLLAFLGFIGLQVVFAQTREITGVVTSSEDGSTIPGASVVVKGTTIGSITDMDGKFTLKVPQTAKTLMVSFVGMTSAEVQITGSNSYAIKMVPESISVDEIVVTALGIKKEQKTLSYSATSVNAEELSKTAATTVMSGIQGKIAGVVINQNSGSPGSSTKVIIRGYSSLNGNNNPIYVIDGVPLDNTASTPAGFDFGNGGNNINPEDVESINILKGAAATALYGSRAANGAVIITTKKGKKGLDIELVSKTAVSNPLRIPEMQNVFGEGWGGNFNTKENGSWGPKMDGLDRLWGNVYNNSQQLKPFVAQKNNLRDFYDTGTSYFNTLSVSGGSDNTTFRLSVGHDAENGFIPTKVDAYNRTNVTFSGSTKFKNLTISTSANYVRRDGSNTPDGRGGTSTAANLFSEIMQMPRDINIVDLKDYKNNPFNTPNYFFTAYAANPYFALNEDKSKFADDRFYGNMGFDYTIMDGLKATLTIGHDVTSYARDEHEAVVRFTPGTPQALSGTAETPGMVYEYKSSWYETNMDLMLSYTKDISPDFSVDGLIGLNTNARGSKYLYGQINSLTIPYYYNLSNTDGTRLTGTYETKKRLMGVYGQASVGYKKYAFLNVTARNDWSSTLPIDANSFFYPSVGLSFLPTEMFPSLKDFMSYGKVRASWGMAGNDAPLYSIKSVMIAGDVAVPYGTYSFPLGGVNGFEVSNQIGNPKLSPELSKEIEFGTDLRFFNNRLRVDFTYYDKKTTNQILPASLAPSTGFTSQIKNFGKVQNVGVELLVNIVPIKTKNFTWDFTANFTRNRNYVLELTDGLDEYAFRTVYNTTLVAQAPKNGEKRTLLGLLKVPGILKDAQGRTVVTDKGYPQTTIESEVIGSIQQDYQLGITNSFRYKNAEFGFSFDIRQGGLMYSGTADLNYFVGNGTQTLYNDRYAFIIPNSVKPNPNYVPGNAATPQYIENDIVIDNSNITDLYYPTTNLSSERDRIISKSYVKLRDMYINYTIPKKWLAVVKLKDASIGLTGHNLLLWTPKGNNFVDPEVTSYGNDFQGEMGEFRTGPSSRSFALNLKLKF